MILYKCDRCDKTINSTSEFYSIEIGHYMCGCKICEMEDLTFNDLAHLCSDCMKDYKKFMRTKGDKSQ